LGFLGERGVADHEISPALEFEAAPSNAFRIGVRLEVAFFTGQLEGPSSFHATDQLGLLAGYSF
jgi:hypothetical protein